MIGLDTNVLIRFITDDDKVQSEIAGRHIQQASEKEELLYINHIVLCETWWVLLRAYKLSVEDVTQTLEAILQTKHFSVESKDVVWKAIKHAKDTGADFADALISSKNESAGCAETLTFDRSAARLLPGFTDLGL